MRRKRFLTTALAGGAAAWLNAPSRALAQTFAQQVTIGINVPLSGDLADEGNQIVDGVRAAVNETNQTLGVLSLGFALRTFDDNDALAQQIENVQFASADGSIVALIGGVDGKLTTAALSTYASVQMPLLVSASTTDSLTANGYRNIWRLPTKDSTEGQLFARFLARRAKPKFALAVTQDGDYGADVASGFVNQSAALRMDADAYVFSPQKPDYAAAATAVLAKKPDYIYLCGETRSLAPLTAALKAGGYNGRFGASEGFFNQVTLDKYRDALADALISTSFPPLERAPDVANVLSDFRSRARLTALSVFSYAAAQIVISAVRRAGATNRLALLSALQSPNNYDTVAGSFTFGPSGDPIDPNVYFYSVTDGAFKYVAPAHPTAFIL